MWTIAQRVAYINTQVACFLAELEGMKAANQIRAHREESPAYDELDFSRLESKYQLGCNDVVKYLTDVKE